MAIQSTNLRLALRARYTMTSMLQTPRLLLRPPLEADLDGWAGFDGDERATRFFAGPRSRAQAWSEMATAAGMWALRGYGLFSVIERDTGAPHQVVERVRGGVRVAGVPRPDVLGPPVVDWVHVGDVR